jgi:aryl-alcohol dehydrogenase-like predicted oxidoreductase
MNFGDTWYAPPQKELTIYRYIYRAHMGTCTEHDAMLDYFYASGGNFIDTYVQYKDLNKQD